jgi:hypothetical protein
MFVILDKIGIIPNHVRPNWYYTKLVLDKITLYQFTLYQITFGRFIPIHFLRNHVIQNHFLQKNVVPLINVINVWSERSDKLILHDNLTKKLYILYLYTGQSNVASAQRHLSAQHSGERETGWTFY